MRIVAVPLRTARQVVNRVLVPACPYLGRAAHSVLPAHHLPVPGHPKLRLLQHHSPITAAAEVALAAALAKVANLEIAALPSTGAAHRTTIARLFRAVNQHLGYALEPVLQF
jgi:hypothetical protein